MERESVTCWELRKERDGVVCVGKREQRDGAVGTTVECMRLEFKRFEEPKRAETVTKSRAFQAFSVKKYKKFIK